MSKSKKEFKKPSPVDNKEKLSKSEKIGEEKKSYSNPIVFNVIALLVAMLFIRTIFKPTSTESNQPNQSFNMGYDWLYNQMLKSNMDFIKENPKLNFREKYISKWGEGEISYLFKIKDSTSEKDILLIPPQNVLTSAGFKTMGARPFSSYFLFPRKVYIADSSGTVPKDVTKIVSFNGWGVDKNVEPPQTLQPFMILNVKKP